MLRQTLGTPCPVPAGQRHFQSTRDSLVTIGVTDDEDTTKIEFTSAFGESWRNTKPRRRQTTARRHGGTEAEFSIHEDHDVGGEGVAKKPTLARPARRGIISQPPQRPRNHNRVSFVTTAMDEGQHAISGTVQAAPSREQFTANRRLSQAPRRPIIVASTDDERRLDALPEDGGHDDDEAATGTMTMALDLTASNLTTVVPKPPRRGTIYIPNDDTTMPSMYMGIFSPIKDLEARRAGAATDGINTNINAADDNDDGDMGDDADMDMTGIAAQMAKKRFPRHHHHPPPPRRRPSSLSVNVNVATAPAPLSPKRMTRPGPNNSNPTSSSTSGALQVTRRHVQGQAVVEDRWGQGGGKENVPPGGMAMECRSEDGFLRDDVLETKPTNREMGNKHKQAREAKFLDLDIDLDLSRPAAALTTSTSTTNTADAKPTRPSKPYGPTTSSLSRMAEKKQKKPNNVQQRSKQSWNAGGPRVKSNQPGPVKVAESSRSTTTAVVSQHHEDARDRKPKPPVPTRFVIPHIPAISTLTATSASTCTSTSTVSTTYPILQDDLAHPAMYEDNWLHHQEIAITQLVNSLFSVSSASGTGASSTLTMKGDTDGDRSSEGGREEEDKLRHKLLAVYADVEMAMLYKRLQGSLLYGALSVPTEVLKGASRLNSDLGRRKAFADLWMETYDLSCLQAALEIVVGRQCVGISSRGSRSGGSGGSSTSGSSSSSRKGVNVNMDSEDEARRRRALQRFIETFLIRNEDGKPDESSTAHASWSYQRTILRSLMLIKLLDTSKASPPAQFLTACLFQASSSYKSSVEVVKALFQLLNPSAGDPIRALNHVGFQVTHVQYPLEEYTYNIENLAVDLRDGVRLTRLVELLLYPSASTLLERIPDSDSTTTVLLPTGELLSLTEGEQDWPLSQHLKFPCLGRATKLYNVQIALSALQGVKGMAPLVGDVRADDIVDGFREKTVKLLWGLTNKWGLCGLVEWEDVEREIKRHCRMTGDHDNDFFDSLEDEDGLARYKMLLKSWAQAIAGKHGMVVKNLTTSFSDGRVFEAIVDEYERYITCEGPLGQSRQLSERLRRLGCSEQFAGLFSTSDVSVPRTHIFDRDFVLAALSFLCSRLLGPSKAGRAAVTIQKAWRLHKGRVMDHRKRWLKTVAERCAEAVQGKMRARQANQDEGQEELCNTLDRARLDQAGPGPGPHYQQQLTSPERTEGEDIWLSL